MLFRLKSHHFRTYFLYGIRYNNVSRPSIRTLTTPAQTLEVATPNPPGLTPMGRRTLRSSDHKITVDSIHVNLVVSFAGSATMHTRSFSVIGPTTWNGLPINRYKALPKRCLFSTPPPSQDCSFLLGLGRERLCVGTLHEGRYINFD